MKVTLNKFIVCSNCLHFYVKSIDCFGILPTSPTDQELRLYFIFYYFVIGSRVTQGGLSCFSMYIYKNSFFCAKKSFEYLTKHTSYELSFMLLLSTVSPLLHLRLSSTLFRAHTACCCRCTFPCYKHCRLGIKSYAACQTVFLHLATFIYSVSFTQL